ncbi:hypothetical protein GMA19_01179 [Paenibacillus polymyxa E681]|nr:hypothetical protein GE561_01179 [Paenibacillus polymyxa E681]QNV60863.1 hypothetical protein GMA19_01179 [Paenibacillus polymyxa E681]
MKTANCFRVRMVTAGLVHSKAYPIQKGVHNLCPKNPILGKSGIV